MTLGRSRDESKEQKWRRWIAQWQTSGLSVAAFCARHGLAAPSFYAWRRTLRRRDNRAFAQRWLYSSWRRHQTPVSLRPLGARSSH